MNTTTKQSTDLQTVCISRAAQIIGNKWTSLIILHLTAGPKRFCQLEDTLGVNPRTLSQRLDDLLAEGIIQKTASSRPDYSLTEKGADLTPILIQMSAWGDKHHPHGC